MELLSTVNSLVDALNRGDAEQVASCFAENGAVISEGLNKYQGRDEIRQSLIKRFSSEPTFRTNLLKEPEISYVTGDVALVEIEFSAQSPKLKGGRSVSVVKKNGDTWVVHSHWLIPAK